MCEPIFLRENHKNNNQDEFPDFYEYYCRDFRENGYSDNGYFCEKFKKSYKD